MNLYNTLKGLILEVASRSDVMDSIRNRSLCSIFYEGDTVNTPGWRTIEPVCFGLSKTKLGGGNPVLRAWQREGASDTPDNMPGWRLFRLDRIRNFNQTLDSFDKARPNYNPNGDKTMRTVYLNAKF